jgi:hypothetical protein
VASARQSLSQQLRKVDGTLRIPTPSMLNQQLPPLMPQWAQPSPISSLARPSQPQGGLGQQAPLAAATRSARDEEEEAAAALMSQF